MQFLILLAIAAVMMTDQIQSPLIFAPGWSGAIAVIASVLALILAVVRAARKKILLALGPGQLPIDLVQRPYMRAQHALRVMGLSGQLLLLFGTQWPQLVRSVVGSHAAGLDELIILLPFVLWLMAGYAFLYDADRAIRQAMLRPMLELSQPVHPVWTRTQYLAFQMRFQLLLIGLPLLLIVSAKDLIFFVHKPIIVTSQLYLGRVHLRAFADLVPEMILALVAGLVFFLAPFLIKWTWRAKSLPPGELRDNLMRLAGIAKLRHRDILLWPTYGVIVNAAVVGFLWPVRYILLSDGLIESLTDGQIEGVFGHEIGHVRLHHLPLFLVFAFASMGLTGLGGWELQWRFGISEQIMQPVVMGAVAAIWFFAFGFVSRRFEAQADLFGAKLLSWEFDRVGCRYSECVRHTPGADPPAGVDPLCLGGAELFASALDRTAALNAVPRTARSWRHGSIAQRCRFVVEAAQDSHVFQTFESKVRRVKLMLLLGSLVTLVWGLWAVYRLATMR